MKLNAQAMKFKLNMYPPYLGAGVRISYISDDWRELHVSMAVRWYNRNAVGTHFGGSLYSMVDPHMMLMLMELLGKGYWVWDKAADIEFVKASNRKVTAKIIITDQDLVGIKEKTKDGEKYLPEFNVEIRDTNGDLVAFVKKTLYIKKRS